MGGRTLRCVCRGGARAQKRPVNEPAVVASASERDGPGAMVIESPLENLNSYDFSLTAD